MQRKGLFLKVTIWSTQPYNFIVDLESRQKNNTLSKKMKPVLESRRADTEQLKLQNVGLDRFTRQKM